MADTRASALDNGGQGCSKVSMANQDSSTGEPLKLDDASLRRLIAVGEPFSYNWRCTSPLYEGEATAWFHVWPTDTGYGVFSAGGIVADYPTKADAISVLGQLHNLYEREVWDIPYRLRECYAEARDTATCYFIGADHGPVKIGVSRQVEKRLRDLQSAYPYALSVLATVEGGYAAERRYHEKFAVHRLHGEWFERHPNILAEIDQLKDRAATGVQSRAALAANVKEIRHGF